MDDVNTYAINKRLDEREDWDALQEVTAELEQAEAKIVELEAKLAKAVTGLKQCQEEIDDYIWQEYPQDNSLYERYRMRDFSSNPARITLAELKGETDEDMHR